MKYKGLGVALLAVVSLTGCMSASDMEIGDISLAVSKSWETELAESGSYEEKESSGAVVDISVWDAENDSTQEGYQDSEEHSSENETKNYEESSESDTEETCLDVLNVLYTGRDIDSRIAQINSSTKKNDGSGVVDLFEKSFNGGSVREMIESYSFPGYTLLSGKNLTEADKKAICDNRNLEKLDSQASFQVNYGILLDNADVRSFPTALRLTDESAPKESEWDYFQESLLLVGEPVAVLHTSSDGEYSFVQGLNYYGWIRSELIGECSSDLAKSIAGCGSFAVITKSFLTVSDNSFDMTLRMGTVLPIIKDEEGYVTAVPVKKSQADACLSIVDGRLCLCVLPREEADVIYIKRIRIDYTDASRGFLSFTTDNLMTLCENLMGSNYSWGDEGEGFDCSSSIGSIYRCFGLILPRNSGQMGYTGTKVNYFTDMSEDEKLSAIKTLPAGTILYVPGHVMMYDGNGGIFHCVTGYKTPEGELQSPYSFVHTSLDIHTRGDDTYLQLIRFGVVIPFV